MPKGEAPDKRDQKYWNRLYHQKKDGTFEDVTETSGLKVRVIAWVSPWLIMTMMATPIYTSRIMAAITSITTNTDGTFTDVTKKLGVAAGGWSTSAAWLDYDLDGRLDLLSGGM